jgi:predicted DNA-binding transcriptional regulator AlpA
MRRFMKMKEVCETTTLSRSEIIRRILAGRFPKPMRLSTHPRGRIVFEAQAIYDWMDSFSPFTPEPHDDTP